MSDDNKAQAQKGSGSSCESPGSLLQSAAAPKTKYSIEPDQGMLVAAESRCTGAAIHKYMNLKQAYLDYCYLGNAEKADEIKHLIYQLVMQCMKSGYRTP